MDSNAKRKRIGWSVIVMLSVASVVYGLLVYLEGRYFVQVNLVSPVFVMLRVLILVVFVPLVLVMGYGKYSSAQYTDDDPKH